jgi:UPF0755 protein
METRKAALHVGAICLRVGLFVMIVLGVVYLGQTTYRYTRAVFSDEAYEEEPGTRMKVTVPEGAGAKALAKVLEEQGIIKDAKVFQLQMKLNNAEDSMKAGTYELSTSMKPSEILEILSGEVKEDTE